MKTQRNHPDHEMFDNGESEPRRCATRPPEQPIPAPIDDHASALVRICELTAQRDELLALVKQYHEMIPTPESVNLIAKCEANK